MNARRSARQLEQAAAAPAPAAGGRGEKFRAIKAREAAAKAVQQVRRALSASRRRAPRHTGGAWIGWARGS